MATRKTAEEHAAFFAPLTDFMGKVPGVELIAVDYTPSGHWWLKFAIDVRHPLAWRVVQELAYVVNTLSLQVRLPARLIPHAPPPYLNGGPEKNLTWAIESTDLDFEPRHLATYLVDQLPRPVQNENAWELEELEDLEAADRPDGDDDDDDER